MANINANVKPDSIDNLSLIESVINDYNAEMDEMLENISELRHTIREKEYEENQREKTRINNSRMFSPNAASSEDYDDYSSEIDLLTKKVEALESKYKSHKHKIEQLKNLAAEYEILKEKNESGKSKKRKSKIEDSGTVSSLKLLEIQELERNRIAGDLHDSAVQNLTGLVHKSELCVKLFDIDETRARLELSSIIDVAKQTIVEIREAIFNLRPAAIDDLGLADAIDSFINTINKEHKIAFMMFKEGKEYNLNEAIQMNMYRIAQEACNNIMKHSKATRAGIILKFGANALQMIITDNGVGIPNEKVQDSKFAHKNFGISIMRERCGVLNGSFEIMNRPEGGTEIVVSVPIK